MKKFLFAAVIMIFTATLLKAYDTFLVPPPPINPGSIERLTFRIKTIEEGDPRGGIPVHITVYESPFAGIEGRKIFKRVLTADRGRVGLAVADFQVKTSGHYEVRIDPGKLLDGRDRPLIVKNGIFQHTAADELTIEREINLSW